MGPSRARSLQVLLGVGAVLVEVAALAVLDEGGAAARLPLLALAVAAAGLSVGAAARGLRSTEEALALCAAGLAGAAAWGTGPGGAALLAWLVVLFLCLRVLAPTTATWSLAAWAGVQLAVLRVLAAAPDAFRPSLFLSVALVGLGIALWGRRPVARLALVTTVPWWVAGVVGGLTTAWTGEGPARHLAAVLVVAAAAGLVPARLRADLDALLGPPAAVPLLAGAVAGAAVAGALAALGSPGITAAGYVGVLAAATLPEYLHGWRRGLFRPVAVAAGSTMALAALVQLSARGDWAALVVLFLLTALPAALVSGSRAGERGSALPWAVGCLAAAAVVAVPAGWLDPVPAAVALTALYAAGLLAAGSLSAAERPGTLGAAAASAAAAVVLVALQADREPLAVLLLVQAVVTVEWAVWTAGPVDAEHPPSPAWRVGAALGTVAVGVAVSGGDVHVLEEYTLPLAIGLLVAQGPRLVQAPSWSSWGPGLLVAAAPSAVMAVVLPGTTRPVLLLVTCAATMVVAAATGVRAPLEIGAATAVGTALALALSALVWPVAAALLVGVALLAVGAHRELFPAPFFTSRLAELR
ncbi:SCO7613 C-terminal domain-containing membrane protein [Geodermatophilus sp. SYSU D00815]